MYILLPEQRLVLVTFGRQLSIRDVKNYVSALSADPLFGEDFSEIVDLSEVEELDLSSEHAIDLADLIDPFRSGVKRAFVARTKVQIHAARMHQILRNDQENIRIFSSLAEARQWIEGSVIRPQFNPNAR
jgi:hypothetical protein